jgi:ABC-2 type transport system permease protein
VKPISAGQQFSAIAFLRWRLFVNAFRRKGGAGELVARIIVYPIGFGFLLGPTLGAGFGAWAAVDAGKLNVLGLIFWGITLLQFFVSINLSQPGLSFDPESLIRFPVSFNRYLVVRLFLGLLSASTIVGTCTLLAAALGATVARPALGPVMFAAAISLAVANMLFLRMIFAWIDRWLSTRRARELFTGVIILVSVGIQYLNVTFNTGFNHHNHAAQKQKIEALRHFYHSSQAILSHLPPGLAGVSIVNVAQGAFAYAIANLFMLWVFAALFLAVFAWRMQREYRGESFSDSGSLAIPVQPARAPAASRGATSSELSPHKPVALASGPSTPEAANPLSACFYKEWIYARRNTAQLYGILGPLLMVLVFAGRIGGSFRSSAWAFPAVLCYSVLGVAALAYNAFGLDAEGIQFYLLAPVPMRTVLLAKNLFNFAISALEMAAVYVILTFVAVRPPVATAIATFFWLAFAVLVNVTLGNMRSIIAPKKMDPAKISRRQASQLSALMSMGAFVAMGAIGGGILYLGKMLDTPWLPAVVLFILAAGALVLYLDGLKRSDGLVATHRETMIEELCKAT